MPIQDIGFGILVWNTVTCLSVPCPDRWLFHFVSTSYKPVVHDRTHIPSMLYARTRYEKFKIIYFRKLCNNFWVWVGMTKKLLAKLLHNFWANENLRLKSFRRKKIKYCTSICRCNRLIQYANTHKRKDVTVKWKSNITLINSIFQKQST